VLIEGGSETATAFLQTLVFALMNWPDAQKRAQEEVDRVIGPDRTPVVQDIDDLPYVQALIREVPSTYSLISVCTHPRFLVPPDSPLEANSPVGTSSRDS